MSNIQVKTVQLKRGNKDVLISVLKGINKPADGEPIWEVDTGKLKFGDGIHDYGDLDYFRTGDIEIEGALDGQILVYNEQQDKWIPKDLADNKSIEYKQDGLQIAGFESSGQGNIPVSNDGSINWQQAVTPELLDEKVAEAEEIKDQAGQFAASALQSKQVAEQAKSQTEQIRDVFLATLNKKFWYGTQAEYVAEIIGGGKLTEGTIYFIYDYNPAFPNENSVTANDD